jgi:WhiB family transcriptional regulator, redox-sensing transcriptional regulator
MERAQCRDHDPALFFPAPGPGMVPSMAAAMALCAMCPVAGECLEYALADPEITGIWGGTSAKARARMRRGLHAA